MHKGVLLGYKRHRDNTEGAELHLELHLRLNDEPVVATFASLFVVLQVPHRLF